MNKKPFYRNSELIPLWDLRLGAGWAVFLFPILALMFFLATLTVRGEPLDELEYAALFLEVIFPLIFAFISNGLILREQEENSLALLAVRRRLSVIWFIRLANLLLVFVLSLGMFILLTTLLLPGLPQLKLLEAALSTTCFLAGVTCLSSLLIGEMNTGYLIGSVVWAVSLIGSRPTYRLVGPSWYPFYLWFTTREGLETTYWLDNKLNLCLIGLFALLACYLLLQKPAKFVQ